MSKPAPFSQLFVMYVVLPLLFIAGVQLYILSAHTDVYFAWTIALPFTAAFMGAGYWAALIAAYMSLRQKASVWARITGPTAVAATTLLGIATFLHLDKFHLGNPVLLTRFVTWVWVIVYIITPLILLWLWISEGLKTDETIGAKPLPNWARSGYLVQAVLTLAAGIFLFFAPTAIVPFWPWKLTPLTARAVSAWLTAYGLACLAVNRENNTSNLMGTRASLLAFCVLQFIALARYLSSFDLSKPLAWVYLLVLVVGVIVAMPGLLPKYSE